MINGRPRRIHLKKTGESAYSEGRAGGTIYPGELIELTNQGLYRGNTNTDGPSEIIFAIEDALAGASGGSKGKTIDDPYQSGDLVRYIIPQRGDHVLALLPVGVTVKTGDRLTSNGTSLVHVANTDSDFIAVALEDRDTTHTDATMENRRIKVRVK